MEDGLDNPQNISQKIETPDGKGMFLFRYENPTAENKNPDSNVSQKDLIGGWFTDSISSLKTYIRMRQPGGSIKVVEVPKDQLEALKAINHPTAKDMDIEPLDNYIVPAELQANSKTFPLSIETKNPNKFLFGDWNNINQEVEDLAAKLQDPAQVS